jgi:ABC-2 type transport system ATP-binding protein
MKRRLNLALALVHDPQILILDEPQAGLDPQSRILVREYIRSLARSKTVLLTTHEMDEADRMADRVGIMDRGRILVVDSPETLKDDYARGEVLELSFSRETASRLATFSPTLPDAVSRLESPAGCLRLGGPDVHLLVPRLMEEMAGAGIAPDDLRVRAPSLEDVFISLTGRRLRE